MEKVSTDEYLTKLEELNRKLKKPVSIKYIADVATGCLKANNLTSSNPESELGNRVYSGSTSQYPMQFSLPTLKALCISNLVLYTLLGIEKSPFLDAYTLELYRKDPAFYSRLYRADADIAKILSNSRFIDRSKTSFERGNLLIQWLSSKTPYLSVLQYLWSFHCIQNKFTGETIDDTLARYSIHHTEDEYKELLGTYTADSLKKMLCNK